MEDEGWGGRRNEDGEEKGRSEELSN